jgi:hypothetical protein
MTVETRPASSAEGTACDLFQTWTTLPTIPGIGRELEPARERARVYEAAYRAGVDVPGGPAPRRLLAAARALERLLEPMDRPALFAGLLHAFTTDNPARDALRART